MTHSTEVPLVEGGQTAAIPKSSVERFAVAIVFTIFVTFRALDRVFLKNVNNALSRSSYNLVWSNVLCGLAVQIITICILSVYIIYLRLQGQKEYTWRFFLPGNAMASSMGSVPLYQLALFSIGDQVQAAMSSPPAAYLTQPIQSVMSNSVLIWTAILASFWIKARFQQVHYVGICLVMMSIMVQISSKVSSNDCSADGMKDGECFSSYKDATGAYVNLTVGEMLLWYLMFFSSTLPLAVGNVYQQVVLQARDVDVCYAIWWGGNFQVLWGWLMVPLLWIPLPGQDVLSPGETFSEIGYTLACLAGNAVREGDETCATSPPPWFWVIIYLACNVMFNVALLWLTKRMCAAWAQVGMVLCLDMAMVVSQFKLVGGDSAEWMSLNDWLALILASIALWSYNLAPETSKLRPAADAIGTGSNNVATEPSDTNKNDEPSGAKNNHDV